MVSISLRNLKMTNQYHEAANKVMEIADMCDDPDVANILKAGYSKIFDLGIKNNSVIKKIASENS